MLLFFLCSVCCENSTFSLYLFVVLSLCGVALVDFQLTGNRSSRLLFRHRQCQHAVFINCMELGSVHIAAVQLLLIGAGAAFPTEISAVFCLFLLGLFLVDGGQCQSVALYADLDLVLLESRQLSIQHVAVTGVPKVGLAGTHRCGLFAEEFILPVPHGTEQVITGTFKRCQICHHKAFLLCMVF